MRIHKPILITTILLGIALLQSCATTQDANAARTWSTQDFGKITQAFSGQKNVYLGLNLGLSSYEITKAETKASEICQDFVKKFDQYGCYIVPSLKSKQKLSINYGNYRREKGDGIFVRIRKTGTPALFKGDIYSITLNTVSHQTEVFKTPYLNQDDLKDYFVAYLSLLANNK